MATIKSYTDLEQSKKLAEILPLASADMFYLAGGGEPVFIGNKIVSYGEDDYDCLGGPDILCWSLAALLGVLPEGVIKNYYAPYLQKENGKYSIAYGDDELLCIADNPVDVCYEMILKLHELNLL